MLYQVIKPYYTLLTTIMLLENKLQNINYISLVTVIVQLFQFKFHLYGEDTFNYTE